MKNYTANLLNTFNRQYAYQNHLIDYLKIEICALKKCLAMKETNKACPDQQINVNPSTSKSPTKSPPDTPSTVITDSTHSPKEQPSSVRNIQNSRTTDCEHPKRQTINQRSPEKSNISSVDQIELSESQGTSNNTTDKSHKTYAEAVSSVPDNRAQTNNAIKVQVGQRRPVKSKPFNEQSDINSQSWHRYENYENNENPVFESVNSRRTRRYYVGGIAEYSNRSGMIQFLRSNGITPATVKIIDTHRGSLAAKITLYEMDWDTVERKQFWPRKMYCRRWYSEAEWESLFYTTADKESNSVTANWDS